MRIAVLALAVLVLASTATRSAGDWIVTRDGTRIETRGPWRLEGRRVVFEDVAGTLSALRREDVDIEASHASSRDRSVDVETSMAVPVTEAGSSVLVLTDADVPRGTLAGPEAGPVAEGSAPSGEAEPAGRSELLVRILSWDLRDAPEIDGVEIVGVLENTSSPLVGDVAIAARIFAADGTPLGESSAVLESDVLVRGEVSRFRVLFEDVADVAMVDLEPSCVRYSGRLAPAGDLGGSGG